MASLNFEIYSKKALKHSMPNDTNKQAVFVMGLCGEAGEIAEKFKKLLRDADGEMTEEFKQETTKELGDVLWYINALSNELGVSLENVAQANLNKIESRFERNTQHGDGDNR